MTMVSNRSELSMSRTGIHGGLRRGTAAAAVGVVLVLSTGVQASLADDAAPPQDPLVQATAAANAAASGGSGDARTPRGKAPAIPAVPGALLPAVKATLSTGSTSATATATATGDAAISGLPVPVLPTVSGTPLAPGGQTAAPTARATAPTGAPGTSSSAAQTGATQKPGSTQPGSTSAAAAGAAPAAGTPDLPGAVPPLLGTGAGEAADQADAQAAGPGSGGTAGTLALDGAGAAEPGGGAGTAAGGAGAAPSSALPTALSINARQSQPTRMPQAAAAPEGPGRAVSSTGPLPEMPDALVWLGAGLVGLGTAAGLVFLRMRRPF
ncbi:hypothetical protein ACTHQ6_02855 [Arthrobacter sp. SAFR-179]|uniref:hypothetical protein n=1 Tax=Arthrobacter sp. SAFR-179 TaxID=3387279 RepID=UPI003F7BF2E2